MRKISIAEINTCIQEHNAIIRAKAAIARLVGTSSTNPVGYKVMSLEKQWGAVVDGFSYVRSADRKDSSC